MTSLRRRLVLALWAALIAVGAVSVVATYLIARNEANALLDAQMQQIAKAVASQSFDRIQPATELPRLDTAPEKADDFIVVVEDSSGKRLYSTREAWPTPSEPWSGFRTVKLLDERLRVFSTHANGLRITVAQPVETRQETATNAALSALFPVVLFLPVMGIVIGLVIRRELEPMRALARDVASRMPLSLTPLTVAGITVEVRPLVDEINELLKRLQVALEADQRFIADAAHALRTPLTALQLQADVLDGSADPAERATRLSELRGGIRRAAKLADELLTLARHAADVPQAEVQTPVDAVLGEILALYAPGAQSTRGVTITASLASAARVPGTARQLTLLFGNLVDNAIRHAQPGGQVELRSSGDMASGWVVVEVCDDGPGLPEPELERVFDRFYRVPGDLTEGNGLGLATVLAITESLGGQVKLANAAAASGLIATVWLPLKARALPIESDPEPDFDPRDGHGHGHGPIVSHDVDSAADSLASRRPA